jgi:hypothetical protein
MVLVAMHLAIAGVTYASLVLLAPTRANKALPVVPGRHR